MQIISTFSTNLYVLTEKKKFGLGKNGNFRYMYVLTTFIFNFLN